jgi:hypothetical protein
MALVVQLTHSIMLAVKSFVLSTFSLALLVACSGASSPEIPVTSQSSTDPEGSGSGSSSSSPSGGSGNAPLAADGGAGLAPPSPPTPPAAPGCSADVEPNDTADHATVFMSCITGELASSKDVDFFRIVAPAKVAKMVVKHTETKGKVLYRVSRDVGLPLVFSTSFTEDAPAMQSTPGAVYVFRLSFPGGNEGKGGGERPYDLQVSFE